MTNHWSDLANSDCILMMGSNPAENHPISFKWVLRAKDRGATLIHVDPRFTRTSSKSDFHTRIQVGTDIAFLGGMIRYIIENNLFFNEYVLNYTNAPLIVNENFSFDDGLFAGFNPVTHSYDRSKWSFEMDVNGIPKRDETLSHPRCVFNLLKKHYDRYTLEAVSSICGTSIDDLTYVYNAFGGTGKPDKAGVSMYAMGWTQHTTGVQNIRTMGIIQLLLGNIGVAGGGVAALRGEANVQGSTDQGLLSASWPGYLNVPTDKQQTFADYCESFTPVSKDSRSVNWWKNKPKYAASLLKSIFPGESVDTAFKWMPKLDSAKKETYYFWLSVFDRMSRKEFKGAFAWGMNPCCSGANAGKNRRAFCEVDWLVNVNLFDNETGSFWRGPDMDPTTIKTEVFFLPCAASYEKQGSIVNSGRWQQWRYKGPDPFGKSKPDGDIMLEIAHALKKLYEAEGGAFPAPVLGLNLADWDDGHGEYDPLKVARLMNGYFLKDTEVGGKQFLKGQNVPAFGSLMADGSTTGGCWVMSGAIPEDGKNLMMRRDKTQTPEQENIGLFPNWSWCWPMNRRILYNRAGVDAKGQPFNPKKAVIQWKDDKWIGDVPDGGGGPGSVHPFIMHTHGFGQLFGPGRVDGPFPEFYEPAESPFKINPFSSQRANPTVVPFDGEEFAIENPDFPYICSTYRVTEHWQTGLMTRRQSWLTELQPQIFCEIDPELASVLGIANGEIVELSSKRGKLDAVAIVTRRIEPFHVRGRKVHMVGIPWHFGWLVPLNGGDSANLLVPSIGDPNTGIPESKAFMVNVMKKVRDVEKSLLKTPVIKPAGGANNG